VHPFAPFLDVEFNVTVVLGYANVPLRGLLELRPESTIELDRAAKAPVDVLVNEKLFARGEMVVVDDGQIGVRVREILGTEPPKAGTQ
jgi:flagellar motor switch protein FliN/FliY